MSTGRGFSPSGQRARVAETRRIRLGGLVSRVVLAALVSGCAGSTISQIGPGRPGEERLTTIALAPSGGLLADAVGVELVNRGFTVVDTQETSSLLARVNLTEREVLAPHQPGAAPGEGQRRRAVRSSGGGLRRPASERERAAEQHPNGPRPRGRVVAERMGRVRDRSLAV